MSKNKTSKSSSSKSSITFKRFSSGLSGIPFDEVDYGGRIFIVSYYLRRGHGRFHPLLLRHVKVFFGERNIPYKECEFVSLFNEFDGAHELIADAFCF